MKKLLLIIVLLLVALVGAQLYGGRDFTQLGFAWSKYDNGGELSVFFEDIKLIIKGEKVKGARLKNSQYSDKILYRWFDETGQMHISERRPEVENYEEIRVGDLDEQVVPGMTNEEINKVNTKDE